jgi:hypothetical protein
MIQILFYVAIGWSVLFAVVMANEWRRIKRPKRRRQQCDPERTVLEEVRELRELGATIDARATDLNKRLETLEKTLVASRITGPKARPEPVAPRSA